MNNTTELFDINCDYKIFLSDGGVYNPTIMTVNNLFYDHNNNVGIRYHTYFTNKKTSTTGYAVTKIQKRKN